MPADSNLLLCMNEGFLDKKGLEKLREVVFEQLNFDRMQITTEESNALYANGLTAGLVVHGGHSRTACTPIVEAYTLRHAAQISKFGGAIQDELLLQEFPGRFQTSFDQNWSLRRMKEQILSQKVTLPDQTVVEKRLWQSYEDFEGVFAETGNKKVGLTALMRDSLKQCEIDCRAALDKFVFSGGNLPTSLASSLPWPDTVKFVPGATEPILAGWRGAALLAQLTTFEWIDNDTEV